jgi:effector-binding domain-containing protein
MTRWFGLGMEDMMGPQFEENLANIKEKLEAMPMESASREIAVVDFPGTKYYGIRIETTTEMAAMQQAYETSYGKIGQFLGVNGLQPTSAPISIMEVWEPENNKTVFYPAMTVAETNAEGNEEIVAGEIPACKVVRCTHKGPYGEMEASWNAAMKYVTDNGMEMAGMPWEQYVSDPGEVPESELITLIYLPVK